MKRIHSGTDHGQPLRRDRRVVAAGELTEEEIELIAKAEVPAEHAHLDEMLKDWRPEDLRQFVDAAPDVPPMPGDELP